MNKYPLYIIFLLAFQVIFSQENSNNLSSSPYSLYGLGLPNDVSTGITNALGKTGIAMSSKISINSLNPASFAAIPKGSFLFDIGIKAERQTFFEDSNIENKFNANFSNIAIAFPITSSSGLGLTLTPFTNVGYTISDIETGIDGSTNTFLSNINGSGGLNNLKLNYGYKISDKIRLGLSGSVLFGKIKEEEINIITENVLNISEESYYNGLRLGLGLQYDLNNNISFGSVVNLPTKLNGEQTKYIIINGSEPKETESNIDDFKLPLEIGFGLHTKLNDRLFFNIDYKRNFWSKTNQSDFIGDFVDQDFMGLGVEFLPKNKSNNYWRRVNYRVGLNMDNGNLAIKDDRITNYALSVGLGLPISTRRHSTFNLGYSFGQKGQVTNGLIKENFHTITLNLSLEDLWFVKRKID